MKEDDGRLIGILGIDDAIKYFRHNHDNKDEIKKNLNEWEIICDLLSEMRIAASLRHIIDRKY